MCGGLSGAIWLLSHHPDGCCTLVVVEEIPPLNKVFPPYVKRFEYPEKCYINVTNYLPSVQSYTFFWVGCVNVRSAYFVAKDSSVSLCLSKHITQTDVLVGVHHMTPG